MTLASEPVDTGPRARAYLFLTLTTLFWAGNAVAGRIAVGEISPMLLIAIRWCGTVVLLLAIGGAQLRRDWPVLRGRLPYLATMGVVGFAAFNALFYLAAHETTAVNIGILQGAMPVLVLMGAVVFFRERLGGLRVLGVAITIAGVLLVVSRGSLAALAALDINHGDFLMLVASLLYAAYALGLRNRPPVSPVSVLTVFSAAAAISSLPLALVEAVLGLTTWPGATGWGVVAYVTVFPSVLSQLFFIKGVGLIGPARAGLFINLVPVFAAMLGVAVLGEDFHTYHLGALALVLSGIWLAERRQG
jgi:drug/metabolite transporter (DMT)-like permease